MINEQAGQKFRKISAWLRQFREKKSQITIVDQNKILIRKYGINASFRDST